MWKTEKEERYLSTKCKISNKPDQKDVHTYTSISSSHFSLPADPFSRRPPSPNRLVNPAVIKDLKAVVFPERQHFRRSSRNQPVLPGGGLDESVDSRL